MKPTGLIAVLFGPPGVGKGTQAEFIARELGLDHVSTGAMLRIEVQRGSALGREVEPIMREGQLVSDDLMVRVLESRLEEDDGSTGVLLDGFPRTVAQAEALEAMLARTGRRIDVVLSLEAPVKELVARILRRAQEEGRSDDTPETIETRLEVYIRETAPVLSHLEGRGTRVAHIDGVGSIDDVRTRIGSAIDHLRGDGRAA